MPASFRAQALSHFKQTSSSHIWVTNSMVGLPGKEIATSATDASMKALLMKMAASDTFDVATETLIKNGQSIHRTLFPTLVVNQGCADCHNSIQNNSSNDLWKIEDLMGAYIVDRYIDPVLALVKRTSLLVALLAAFCTAAFVIAGKYFFAQRRLADQLKTLAATDPLTGCINRREMNKRIDSMTSGASGALMMIDLDHFKKINDRFGHRVGDLVLTDFTQRLRKMLRQDDWIARIGGEEFVVWLPNLRLDDARKIAERFRTNAETAALIHDGSTVSYTISVGLQMIEQSSASHFDGWLAAADLLLYRAKSEGRNRVVFSEAQPV